MLYSSGAEAGIIICILAIVSIGIIQTTRLILVQLALDDLTFILELEQYAKREWMARYNAIAPHREPLTSEELEQRSDKVIEVLDEHDLI